MKVIKKIYQEFYYSQYIFYDRNASRKGHISTWGAYFILRTIAVMALTRQLEIDIITGNRIIFLFLFGNVLIDFLWILRDKERNTINQKAEKGINPNKYMYIFTKLYLLISVLSVFFI